MDDAELINAVRAACGKVVGDSEIEDSDVLRASDYILKRVADKITVRIMRSLTSVANQREYTVHSDTMRIQTVFITETSDANDLILGSHGSASSYSGAGASEYYNFPSLWKIHEYRRARGLPRIRYYFNPMTRLVSIDPMPISTGVSYWYISVEKNQWNLDNVPGDFEELITDGVIWRMMEQLGMVRSRLGGTHRDGGKVEYPASEIWRLASSKKKEFWEALMIKAKVYRA